VRLHNQNSTDFQGAEGARERKVVPSLFLPDICDVFKRKRRYYSPCRVFALFLQPARLQAIGMPKTIFIGQNGTEVQFSTPENQDDDLSSSRTVSVAAFSSSSSGMILSDERKLPIDKVPRNRGTPSGLSFHCSIGAFLPVVTLGFKSPW